MGVSLCHGYYGVLCRKAKHLFHLGDFVLATVPVALPWAEYLNVLKANGELGIVGAAPGEISVPVFRWRSEWQTPQ